uniref:Uncharacterized protein n=1 Tax=Macrostomum lignano TaxID=282301 RepID=A0A1I8F3Z7_9PLAT
MSDPESCSSCGESSIESSATAAAAAAATESRLTCSSPGSRTASEEAAAARQNNFGQEPFLRQSVQCRNITAAYFLALMKKHQHGMLNLLPETDAASCLPDGFIYDANFNEATNANCVLVTTAIGVERALA